MLKATGLRARLLLVLRFGHEQEFARFAGAEVCPNSILFCGSSHLGIGAIAIAVLSVAVALTVSRLPAIHLQDAPVSLFLCAVLLSAWFGGVIAGLIAMVLSPAPRFQLILPAPDPFLESKARTKYRALSSSSCQLWSSRFGKCRSKGNATGIAQTRAR